MTEFEKVVAGLEKCAGIDCAGCPYRGCNGCQNKLANDALCVIKLLAPKPRGETFNALEGKTPEEIEEIENRIDAYWQEKAREILDELIDERKKEIEWLKAALEGKELPDLSALPFRPIYPVPEFCCCHEKEVTVDVQKPY